MDANENIIPIVEGDRGEGFKDPYEEKDDDPFQQSQFQKVLEEQASGITIDTPKKQGVFKNIEEPKLPPPQRMRMKKGMRIHFYGYSYKVTAVRPNGKITLRFDGEWKGGPNG